MNDETEGPDGVEDLWDIDDLLESMKKTKQPTIKLTAEPKKKKDPEVQYFDIEELDV